MRALVVLTAGIVALASVDARAREPLPSFAPLIQQTEPAIVSVTILGAGIRRGDVIVRWGNEPVTSSRDLPRRVAATPPGTRVPVELVRDEKRRTVEVVVARMPRQAQKGPPE